MKAKELAQLLELIVRKVVREELKPILSEVKKSSKPIIKERKVKVIEKDPLDINLSELLSETPTIAQPKVAEKKTYMKNPMLNEMLNDVNTAGEWRNMESTFGANQAQGFVQGGSQSVVPTTDIDGRVVDTNNEQVAAVAGAMTKDYSQLLKAIDKKKGK